MSQFEDPTRSRRFGVISDTQEQIGAGVTEALAPLKKLEEEGVKMDFIVHVGDLANTGGKITRDIIRAKMLKGKYQKEKRENQMSEEILHYVSVINSPEYISFSEDIKKKGVDQDIVVYALWLAKGGGYYDEAIGDMSSLIKNVTDSLGEFDSEVKHVVGNADRTFPEKLETVKRLLTEQGIDSYDQPVCLPIDKKTSVVFWPSFAVDEKNEDQTASLLEMIDKFSIQMRDNDTVLIFAHETPFKGPKQPGLYQDRLEESGFKRNSRTPSLQFQPVSKFVLELCRRLPARAKIALVCGHMHDPREVIEAGTQYLKFDQEGKAKLRLFGVGKEIDKQKYEILPNSKRTVDLYYLPEGEVGLFEINNDGNVCYEKLNNE